MPFFRNALLQLILNFDYLFLSEPEEEDDEFVSADPIALNIPVHNTFDAARDQDQCLISRFMAQPND